MKIVNKRRSTLAAFASVLLSLDVGSLLAQMPNGSPAGMDATLDFLTEHLGFTPPLSDFLYTDPGQVLLQDAQYGLDLGETEVEGVRCRHLAFVQEAIDWQIWIEQGKMRVPRKLAITYKLRPGAPQYVALLSDWDLSTPIAESLFTADIPEGTAQISFLKVPPPEGAPEKQ